MQHSHPIRFVGLNLVAVFALVCPELPGAFEGRIAAELVRSTETNALLYTVGANRECNKTAQSPLSGMKVPRPIANDSFRKSAAAARHL